MVIGIVAGVRIKVNFLFLLICIVYACLGLGWEIVIIFSSILIHELAHTFVALALDVKVAEIELLPFGGQAKIEDFTALNPGREIYIAIAGPVLSLSLAGIFYFLQPAGNVIYSKLFFNINMFIGLFNLLPALPLDGGRILRAILSKVIGYKAATVRSAVLGKIIALGLVVYGTYQIYYLKTGINYLLMGVLLFWAAAREEKFLIYAFMRYLVNKKGQLSRTGFLTAMQIVSREDTLLKNILANTRPTSYMVVMIVDEADRITGIRTESELIECLFEKGSRAQLKDC